MIWIFCIILKIGYILVSKNEIYGQNNCNVYHKEKEANPLLFILLTFHIFPKIFFYFNLLIIIRKLYFLDSINSSISFKNTVYSNLKGDVNNQLINFHLRAALSLFKMVSGLSKLSHALKTADPLQTQNLVSPFRPSSTKLQQSGFHWIHFSSPNAKSNCII